MSDLGDGASLVAYPWLASTLTRNPVMISATLVASRLPWLLFSLPAGIVVDRMDRRILLVCVNVVRAGLTAAIALLVLAGLMSIWLLCAGILLLGAGEVVSDIAAGAVLPSMVAHEQLERANGRLWSAQSAANGLLGPALGGALLAIGIAVPIMFDAGTFAVAAGLLLLITGQFRGGSARASTRLVDELHAGLRFVWREPVLRTLVCTEAVLNTAATMAIATYVLYVRENLGLGGASYGILMTAGAIGVIIGSLVASRVVDTIGVSATVIMFFAIATTSYLVTGTTSQPVVAGVANAGFTLVAVIWNVVTVSFTQRVVPGHLMGRVGGVNRWFAFGAMPLGAISGGLLVQWLTPLVGQQWAVRSPFLLSGVIFAVTGAAVGRHFTSARLNRTRAADTDRLPDLPRGQDTSDARHPQRERT
jgi:MFS family permease